MERSGDGPPVLILTSSPGDAGPSPARTTIKHRHPPRSGAKQPDKSMGGMHLDLVGRHFAIEPTVARNQHHRSFHATLSSWLR